MGSPARLRLADRALVVERLEQAPLRVPLEDLGVLIIDHPQVTLTAPLLQACSASGTAIVVCDAKHLPSSALLPFAGHSLHARVVQAQAAASRPTRKRLWAAIVRAKIRAQAECLARCGGDSAALAAFAERVRSGDPDNVEAQAAQAYWPRLFGAAFRRDPEAEGINALLNYGYAIVRTAVARALVGSGLHPALGLHHRNQYNPYALADDLMEPLRPAVDGTVHALTASGSSAPVIARPIKEVLLGITALDAEVGGERLPFFVALPRFTASIVRVLQGEADAPLIPRLLWHEADHGTPSPASPAPELP